MRIISKEHDYYDCIMGMSAYDQDDIKYIRNLTEIQYSRDMMKNFKFPEVPRYFDRVDRVAELTCDIIGFCGKIYPYITVSKKFAAWPDKNEPIACHTIEQVKDAVRILFRDDVYDSFITPDRNKRFWKRNKWNLYSYNDLKKFMESFGDHEALFEEHKTPIFVVHRYFGDWYDGHNRNGNPVTINATLKHYEFQRVFDPYQAFQKIAQYIGNMAFPNKPIPAISNEDMIAAKGFDLRYSFRADKKAK